MATITWSDDLAIDDSQIDFQHRQLLDTIADLEDALATADAQRIAAVIPFLHLYVQTHFADEERVLEMVGWPRLAEHRELHAGFSRRLDEFEAACSHGDLAAGGRLLAFLASWLAGHIRVVDHAFADDVRRLRTRGGGGRS